MARRKSTISKNKGKRSRPSGRARDRSAILWVAGTVLLAMLFIYWQNAGVVKKASVAERKVSKTLKKFPIRDSDISDQKTDKRSVKSTPYVQLVKPKAVMTPVAISVAKGVRKPRVAIVLDDFGYNMSNFALLSEIREPITLSILPELRYSSEVAKKAKAKGYEVILHLPLESERSDVEEEADTIRTGMSVSAVHARLAHELRTVPGASGVSNHMGSKSTSERDTMSAVFTYLKKNDLFFLDSMTSPNSVCREVASETGIRYARRDIFLDNSNNLSDIEAQIETMRRMAKRRGLAIAVGHDRKNTIIALRRMIPELRKDGIEVVPLSEVVK